MSFALCYVLNSAQLLLTLATFGECETTDNNHDMWGLTEYGLGFAVGKTSILSLVSIPLMLGILCSWHSDSVRRSCWKHRERES